MHLFVRDLQGTTLSFQPVDIADLRFGVADRTGVPPAEQRLVFNSKQLPETGALDGYGLAEGSTLHLLLRLKGGAPKKRCASLIATTERCSSPALRIVGDCSFCNLAFCGRHRLPEDHKCLNLSTCRQDAFLKNKAKLESERMVGDKIASM